MNINNHPCFNDKKRHLYARVHLPVAPKCNIQCNYCVRKYDCINESKPGITSEILAPEESIIYLESIMEKLPNVSVVGIAGPGDPFANPAETMRTLRLVRNKYPEMMLCVATNGLNILPYIDELAELKVSHITVTINAVAPEIGAKIYSWVKDNKNIYHKEEGAALLISRQLEAVSKLKKKNILVKINTIIIPSVNVNNIIDVAEKVKSLGADIINCIPMMTNAGSVFENITSPDKALVTAIRSKITNILPQMYHCQRCRADAVGLIEKKMTNEDFDLLKSVSVSKYRLSEKEFVAVGSREGLLINQHLGEMSEICIYKYENNRPIFIGKRIAPNTGGGDERWKQFTETIKDCSAVFVSGAGGNPEKIFSGEKIKIIKTEGFIEEVLAKYFSGKKIIEKAEGCGRGLNCSGTGNGCG